MVNIDCSLSNDLIVECKDSVRKRISSSLNIYCDDLIACIREPIDLTKFEAWFQFNLNNFKSKTNQVSYFKKAFLNELEKGTFKVEVIEYVPNVQPILNDLRAKGICVMANESAYIYCLWEYLLNDKKVDIEACKKVNRGIVNLMQKGQSFNDYKDLVQRANTLAPYKIKWKEVEARAEAYINDWNKLFDELESEE